MLSCFERHAYILFITMLVLVHLLRNYAEAAKKKRLKRGSINQLYDNPDKYLKDLEPVCSKQFFLNVNIFTTFDEARELCRINGYGDLAVILNEEEQHCIQDSFLTNLVLYVKTESMWLGLRDFQGNGTFVWVNGMPLNYTNWVDGAPSILNNFSTCTSLAIGGLWVPDSCKAKRPVFCRCFNESCDSGTPESRWVDVKTPEKSKAYNKPINIGVPSLPANDLPKLEDTTNNNNKDLEDNDRDFLHNINFTFPDLNDYEFSEVTTCKEHWFEFNRNCYFFSTSKISNRRENWHRALRKCKELNSLLVKIDSPEENDFIAEHIIQDSWISLNDLTIEGQFTWLDNTLPEFTNWAPNQPDNGHFFSHNCVQILGYSSGQWRDESCMNKIPYVCKAKLGSEKKPFRPPTWTYWIIIIIILAFIVKKTACRWWTNRGKKMNEGYQDMKVLNSRSEVHINVKDQHGPYTTL